MSSIAHGFAVVVAANRRGDHSSGTETVCGDSNLRLGANPESHEPLPIVSLLSVGYRGGRET